MKINEFIERFNELDTPYSETYFKISATKEKSFAHGVVINVFKNNKFAVTAARLPEGVSAWDFYGGAPFSPEMLELMAELAKTPPEEREDADAVRKRGVAMGTTIYTADGDWISTPTPYEKVRSWLLDNQRPYLEIVGYQGNSYLIQISQITCVEQKLPGNEEEKK